jgi:inosose dehydratase
MTKPRLACFTNSYGRFGGSAALHHLPKVGIEWLELPIRTAGTRPFFGDQPLVTTESTLKDIADLKSRIAEAGLRLASCNITTGNPLDPKVLTIIKKKLDLAQVFEVDLVVGGAGEAETETERDVLYQHLQAIGDHAAGLGITYCFETHPGLCQHPDSMRDLMERLRHPHVGLNFDTGNILYYNQNLDVGEALRSVRKFVRHVHLKDTNGQYKAWHFPALGAGGAVDFAQVKHLLDEVGYDGPYSLEIEGIQGEPELALADYQDRIAASLDHLKRCGF